MTLRAPILCCLAIVLASCGTSSEPPGAGTPAPRQDTVIAPATPTDRPGTTSVGTVDEGVYVWQRMWLPANLSALAQSRGMFSDLRVLAAQDQPGEGWIDARVDLPSLKSDGRAVRPVIRLDGRLAALDSAAIVAKALDLVATWRAAGAMVDGVEIDFDCAASRLDDYAVLLAAIKAKLPPRTALSITALPSWMDAPGLAGVLAQADEAVLQVHAVTDPKHGLFDPKQAREWIERFAKASTKPFRVALPAYGSALVVDGEGHAVGVESESGLAVAGERLELFADPQAVAHLVHDMREKPPANFRGFLWFRLPLAGDRRAWPLATIAAVIAGRELHADFTPEIGKAGNGASDLSVRNSGNLEAALPSSVDVEGQGCGEGDALPGYRIDRSGGKLRFMRESHATLPATQSRPIGWVRCTHLTVADLHAHP